METKERLARLAEAQELMVEIRLLQNAHRKIIHEANLKIAEADQLTLQVNEKILAVQDLVEGLDD